MGLDLLVMGRPKPGHEEEWARLMAPLYENGEDKSEADQERRLEISLEGYEVLGAPRVGFDPEADAWFLENTTPNDPTMTPEQRLADAKGYYVLALVNDCPGLPQYTHAGMYEGVDETSFRGKFLQSCEGLMGSELLEEAWEDVKSPASAVQYGKALLEIVEDQEVEGGAAAIGDVKPDMLRRIFGRWMRPAPSIDHGDDEDLEEQFNILRAAGNWYIFWGERGHPIGAWF